MRRQFRQNRLMNCCICKKIILFVGEKEKTAENFSLFYTLTSISIKKSAKNQGLEVYK